MENHNTQVNAQDTRRYDLDWLRIIAFGLLILYHVGMFYVSWGWHVKSPHAGPFAEPAMMLLNPWRMPLLFLISGVAIIFAAEKMGLRTLSWKRTVRLFVPLVFGMLFIVAPQSYFELLAKGEIQAGYLEFYQIYVSGHEGYSVTVPTWNHLWYLVYLITYSLIVLPFVPAINWLGEKMDTPGFERLMSGGRIFLIPAALFVTYRFTTDIWFPEHTHALVDDWGAHARYFSYFIVGMLIAKNTAFWRVLAATWRTGLVLVLVSAAILLPMWVNWENWTGNQWFVDIIRAWRVIYAWAVIATVMGVAQHYLNRPSKRLSYLTEAVFPYYILHQTLIVVIGVAAASLALPAAIEFLVVLAGTVLGCLLLHEYIIRRTVFLRPLFGLPLKPKQRQSADKLQPAE
ncbi:MAG: acyltransferase family protein [Kordiimonadaceae bacterium]|nr:acyltransferase family protein [Kordiimonadaceae bacterium]